MIRQYLCIDQRSFYASVECVIRGLDPAKTRLVVADPERSQNTICLAVSPALKALGIKNRCRIREIPDYVEHIVAPPQMQLYIDYAAEIYGVFLKYIAPEDIYVYSIDESFLDVTAYLKMYNMTAKELAIKIIQDIKDTVGTISTCGIGTNLYLAKVALDIMAKKSPEFIGILDEETYRNKLWDHKPITDFWRISTGTAERLKRRGITTLRGVTETPEDYLYDLFGIDAEILIDHAWGRESVTIADIKNYHSDSKSISSSQVLMRDYQYKEGELIAKEMIERLCLRLSAEKLVTESVSMYIGYSYTEGVPGAKGTAKLAMRTNAFPVFCSAISTLYRRIVNPSYVIRRVCLSCNDVTEDTDMYQLNMFEDTRTQLRTKALQETIVSLQAKYGKNTILRGMNFEEAATGRIRNTQIGGHSSG